MAQASIIAAWAMLLLKAAAVMACVTVVLCLFWIIRTRSPSQKKDDDHE